MKVNALTVLTGVAGSLALCSAASATLGGGGPMSLAAGAPPELQVYELSVDLNVGRIFQLWVGFTSPTDRLLGIPKADIRTVGGGTLFQHPFGSSTAPNAGLFGVAPELAFESFVTIGLGSVPTDGADSTALEPGAGFTGDGGTAGFAGGWFNSNPDNDQGVPGAHSAPPGADPSLSYVLIAQLTLQNPTRGAGIVGDIMIAWKGAGDSEVRFTAGHFTTVAAPAPAPAAPALLGLAGLSARRRRA